MRPSLLTAPQRIAVVVSLLLIPPIVSAVTFSLLAVHFEQGDALRIFTIAFIAISFTGIIPLLYVLYLRKERLISRYDAPAREQRTNPYLMSVFYSSIGFFILLFMKPSVEVLTLTWCYAVNTAILLMINLRWKISAHMMGLTGPLLMLFFLFRWNILYTLPVVVLLGWARVSLRVHTPAQVVAGAIAGIALTYLQLFLVSRFLGRIFSPFVFSPLQLPF